MKFPRNKTVNVFQYSHLHSARHHAETWLSTDHSLFCERYFWSQGFNYRQKFLFIYTTLLRNMYFIIRNVMQAFHARRMDVEDWWISSLYHPLHTVAGWLIKSVISAVLWIKFPLRQKRTRKKKKCCRIFHPFAERTLPDRLPTLACGGVPVDLINCAKFGKGSLSSRVSDSWVVWGLMGGMRGSVLAFPRGKAVCSHKCTSAAVQHMTMML